MSLGPATLRLAAARSVIPFIPKLPGEFFELGDRSWKQDSLINIEEVDTRQVGGFDLARLQAEQPKPSNVPREPTDLEERTRGADFLSRLWRLGNRNEELDARQIGSFDLATLIAEQIEPEPVLASGNLPSGASDLEERSRKSDSLLRILGYGRRDIEDIDARQLGSFNLPQLVSSSLTGRQVGSFDLPELLTHQFTRKAQPDPAERELTKELEEGIGRVARMIGRKLERTLD